MLLFYAFGAELRFLCLHLNFSLFSRLQYNFAIGFSFVKVSPLKTFQHRAPSSKRAAWARTRAAAYRARQDSSYLSVEEQYPLSFQPRSRRSSRPRSPISRSVSPTSRALCHHQGELEGGRNYRSSSPISVGLREDLEPHPMVGVISVTLKEN